VYFVVAVFFRQAYFSAALAWFFHFKTYFLSAGFLILSMPTGKSWWLECLIFWAESVWDFRTSDHLINILLYNKVIGGLFAFLIFGDDRLAMWDVAAPKIASQITLSGRLVRVFNFVSWQIWSRRLLSNKPNLVPIFFSHNSEKRA